jgi:thiol-disulfide isomerase/thioredoxin
MGKFNRIRNRGKKLVKRLRSQPAIPQAEARPTAAQPAASQEPEPAPIQPAPQTGTRLLSAVEIKKAIAAIPGPVLINHWATWCEGCVEELPLLVALHDRFGDDLSFLGVSWECFQFDPPNPVAQVVTFSQNHGLLWDSLLVQDTPNRLFEVLEMTCQTVPQILLLDAAGQVVYHCETVLDTQESQNLAAAIQRVLS